MGLGALIWGLYPVQGRTECGAPGALAPGAVFKGRKIGDLFIGTCKIPVLTSIKTITSNDGIAGNGSFKWF